MKDFHFNPEIAKEYGVDEAIFLYHIDYWIEHNKASGTNYHNGRYWTYNSIKAFVEVFPFWNIRQIRHIVDGLRNRGVLIIDEFNEDRRDRTMWYTIDYDLLQNCQMQLTNLSNASDKNGNSIYNIDNNKDIHTNNKHTDICGDAAQTQCETAIIPATSEKRKEICAKEKRGTTENLCLFADSKYNDIDLFVAQFNAPEYAKVDVYYYYGKVRDWSAQGGKKKRDWIATARSFMRGDHENGKLQTIKSDDYNNVLQMALDLCRP